MKYEIIKGSEKDFEGAPEGCTKVLVCFGETHYVIGDKTSEGITVESSDEDSYLIAERRPITEPKSAIPIYGSEMELDCGIEFYTHDGRFCFEEGTRVVVGGKVNFGLGDFLAVKIKGTNVINDVNPVFLRPIRSPEDVARDEAKAAIAELCRSSASNGHSADLIYDAIAAGKIKVVVLESNTSDLKISITTDEMWREFEKKSDMEDVYKLFRERASRRGSF